MKPVRGAVLTICGLALALVPLLLLDGARRTTGFRMAAVVLGVILLRTIAASTADAPPPPADSPFARPRRRRIQRRRRLQPARTPLDAVVIGATERSGQFHHRLRPALREAADERLRAGHGVGIDDDGAARLLGPVAWDHLRPDRPAPEDRRSPGIDEGTLRTIFDAVEAL